MSIEEIKKTVEANEMFPNAEAIMFAAQQAFNLRADYEDDSIFWDIDEILNEIAEILYNADYYEELMELFLYTGYGREYLK